MSLVLGQTLSYYILLVLTTMKTIYKTLLRKLLILMLTWVAQISMNPY